MQTRRFLTWSVPPRGTMKSTGHSRAILITGIRVGFRLIQRIASNNACPRFWNLPTKTPAWLALHKAWGEITFLLYMPDVLQTGKTCIIILRGLCRDAIPTEIG